ncbi:hypothetical protein KFK09_010363 [Dendrobium nobile]|uniref:Uncharacterized protein n=1 Tax=Dendrobium nobile TaxID=94219 RepID=A0A8T3BMB9_DENNO|nr:hypothetical protein KFK09_010363 [Dendrobium nobile]
MKEGYALLRSSVENLVCFGAIINLLQFSTSCSHMRAEFYPNTCTHPTTPTSQPLDYGNSRPKLPFSLPRSTVLQS